jgi:cardiolipin synthase
MHLNEFTDGALTRAAGAPLIGGNRVRLLRDAAENYPAWIKAIESAEKWIHFETYIIHDDTTGRQFADLLAAKARAGVTVRLMYDWVGSLGHARPRFFRNLSRAGVDVRCFNPPGLEFPFTWFTRDHRKVIAVDGRVAFVTGLCVGEQWNGSGNSDPWRDNGIELEGPAVAEIERAFGASWATQGSSLPDDEVPQITAIPLAGNVPVRVVAGIPSVAGLYRVDQLLTTFATQSIWLEDAYFVGTSSYIQALRAASNAGVDVRLLIPGSNDIPVMRALSRAGLRPLLEAGVRIFEWNGAMMHAKTAVVDGQWTRVGSTNLNLASWLGNWEIDVIVEDPAFGKQVQEMFVDDLQRSTEIVLDRNRPRPVAPSRRPRDRFKRGNATKTAAGVVRLGHAVGQAIADRELGPAEAVFIFWIALLLIGVSLLGIFWPRSIAWPAAIAGFWVSMLLLVRAYKLRRSR